MGKKTNLEFGLGTLDDLFSTQEERDEAELTTIKNVKLDDIHSFPNHPFKVKMDEKMLELTESVRQHGVLMPAYLRPIPEGGYQMVAGHRRHKASELAELDTIPAIIRELTDDEATIIMVDTNLQREEILPSEKAFAYKMKLEALKRQGTMVIVEFGEVNDDRCNESTDGTSE